MDSAVVADCGSTSLLAAAAEAVTPTTSTTATYYHSPHSVRQQYSTPPPQQQANDTAHEPPEQPLLSAAECAGGDCPEQYSVDSSDWGLSCIALLDWFGYATTHTWLSVDPERRALALLLRREPYIVEHARAILHASAAYPVAERGIDVPLFDKHVELLAFCHNNLQHRYCATVETHVSAQRFICTTNADGCAAVAAACELHSAELVLHYANEYATACAVGCSAYRTVCVDGELPYKCRTAELNDVLHAFRLSTAWRKALALCVVLAIDRVGVRGHRHLVVSSAAFVSLEHYRECAGRAAELTRHLMHDRSRKHLCASCALCPAVYVLSAFGAGTAPPLTPLAPDSNNVGLSTTNPPEYDSVWRNPRCVHTELTRAAGAADVRHAVLWYFGGVADPAQVLLEVAQALCHDGGTLADALALIQDTVLQSVAALKHVSYAQADSVREQCITRSLARRLLYSFALGATLTSCSLVVAISQN